jgi:SAM-dependent methyltransferase
VRAGDGSAGDANYAAIGGRYIAYRQPEPLIASRILDALDDARSVLNVGAGAGSYEPADRPVTAVEPSASMRAQRPAHLSQAIDAVAEKLPFESHVFDASMATFTIHQWADLAAGLREMRRVTRGPVVLLSCDPKEVQQFWLNQYAQEVLTTEARRYPDLESIRAILEGTTTFYQVPIPLECKDGFNEAYYGRPEMLLDQGARQACSAWSFVERETSLASVEHLASEIKNGRWDGQFGHLRTQPFYVGSLRLVVNLP